MKEQQLMNQNLEEFLTEEANGSDSTDEEDARSFGEPSNEDELE